MFAKRFVVTREAVYPMTPADQEYKRVLKRLATCTWEELQDKPVGYFAELVEQVTKAYIQTQEAHHGFQTP